MSRNNNLFTCVSTMFFAQRKRINGYTVMGFRTTATLLLPLCLYVALTFASPLHDAMKMYGKHGAHNKPIQCNGNSCGTSYAKPFSKDDALEAVSRFQIALEKLKRQGNHCSQCVIDVDVSELNSTLSSDFESYYLNTNGFDTAFDRAGYLSFMTYIAKQVYTGWSQHYHTNEIINFSVNGKTAYVTYGKLLEQGEISNLEELSISEYTAVLVLEGNGSSAIYKVKQFSEYGNRVWNDFIPSSWGRDFPCSTSSVTCSA